MGSLLQTITTPGLWHDVTYGAGTVIASVASSVGVTTWNSNRRMRETEHKSNVEFKNMKRQDAYKYIMEHDKTIMKAINGFFVPLDYIRMALDNKDYRNLELEFHKYRLGLNFFYTTSHQVAFYLPNRIRIDCRNANQSNMKFKNVLKKALKDVPKEDFFARINMLKLRFYLWKAKRAAKLFTRSVSNYIAADH